MLPAVLLVALATEPTAVPQRAVRDALDVHPGATCLDRDDLTRLIVENLGRGDVDASFLFRVRGDETDPGKFRYEFYRADVLVGVRPWDDFTASCDAINATVAVSIASTVDGLLVFPPTDTEEEPPPARSQQQDYRGQDEERPLQPRPEPSVAPPRRRPWQLRLAPSGGVAMMGSPLWWAGYGELAIEGGWRDFVDVRVSGWGALAPARTTRAGTMQLSLAGGRVDVCGGYRWGIVRPRGCLGGTGGVVIASGRNFVQDRRQRLGWGAVTFGADLRLRLTQRVEFELGVDALVHVARVRLTFQDETGATRPLQRFAGVGVLAGMGFVFVITD